MTTWNPAVASRADHGLRAHRPRPARRAPAGLGLRPQGRPAVFYLGCLLAAGSYGLTLLLPSLVKAAGGSPAQAGLIYWCGALGASGALVLSGRLTQRIGAGWAAAAGAALYALAAAGFASCGPLGGIAYAAGVLLGAGWALFFTCAPIIASSIPGPARVGSRFLVLAGFNALGIGAGPIVGQLLAARGTSARGIFALAALGSLASGALFCLAARRMHPPAATTVQAGHAARGVTGPVRLVLASRARTFVLMAGLGACVFTTMTSYQVTLAASRGLNPSVFYACYTLGVIIPRFTLTSVLASSSRARATTALLAGMCLSLSGFMLAGHNLALYAVSSALLGVTYGLAYPLIQAQAADSAPAGLRHWTLWYFSFAYFAGPHRRPHRNIRPRTRHISQDPARAGAGTATDKEPVMSVTVIEHITLDGVMQAPRGPAGECRWHRSAAQGDAAGWVHRQTAMRLTRAGRPSSEKPSQRKNCDECRDRNR